MGRALRESIVGVLGLWLQDIWLLGGWSEVKYQNFGENKPADLEVQPKGLVILPLTVLVQKDLRDIHLAISRACIGFLYLLQLFILSKADCMLSKCGLKALKDGILLTVQGDQTRL